MFLYYPALRRFKKKFYAGLLQDEHLEPGKRHFKSLDIKGQGNEKVDYWAYELYKDNDRYLVDFKDDHPLKVLPIKVDDVTEVASTGTAYFKVNDYAPARFKSEKAMEFSELVDILCQHEHTNPNHQRLLTYMALASFMTKTFFRVCSPPSAGKDSSVTTLQSIIGRVYNLQNPSAAKLSLRTNSEWLVINEVAEIENKDWKIINQFLLQAGDRKMSIEKPTRAFKGVGETLDISDLSISVFFNDIYNYTEPKNHFDNRTTDAVKDRFAPFRVHGHYTEDWSKIHKIDYEKAVDANHQFYRDIISTILYFKEEMQSELSRYNHDLLYNLSPQVSSRHKDSLTLLLNIIDLDVSSQEEFNAWCVILAKSMKDYQDMLEYDVYLEHAKKKLRKGFYDFKEELEKLPTYSERIKKIKEATKDENKDNFGDVKIF